MEKVVMLLVCTLYVLPVQCEVTLEADWPSVKVYKSHKAELKCCFSTKEKKDLVWVKFSHGPNKTTNIHFLQNVNSKLQDMSTDKFCAIFTINEATFDDAGFYRCFFNSSQQLSHGTYLQVHKPLEKTINLSEQTKNIILCTEGILLLLCVIVPSVSLLFKSKNLNDMEKRKVNKEEENIYQGLDLNECYAEYDKIERLQGHGPYEDVGNNEEDIQLEKP